MNDHDDFDLCIVGAGYAGLNAAFVASQYLPATARVLVLDKHQQAGGMWNDAYSYVRLHQPYRMFTAGNIPWKLGRERSYLATRDEVAAHLRHCFDVISKRFVVDARWGWEYLGHTEGGGSVVVTACGPDGEVSNFRTERFIDARGFDVESNDALALASRHVRSVAPRELEETGLLSGDHTEPVWVIGSGKTAMDTIVALVRANPARRIGMVTGTGTYFFNRDLVTPAGVKRWTGGVRYSSIFTGVAKRFDGTNAAEVSEWCRAWCGTTSLGDPPPTHLLFAFLSEDETATVATGVSEVIRDHLVDVIDDGSGPIMLLRKGARQPIPSGSWVINCTGHLKPRDEEHVPYVSPSGKAMSINSTSTAFGNSAISAYFLSHLFFLNELVDAPLYELDMNGLGRNAPEAFLAVWSTLIQHNLSVVLERAPMRVFQSFKLDFDQWYPLPRQIPGLVRLMRTHKRDRPHRRHALDTFSQHANVRCGPLRVSAPSRAAGMTRPDH
jgi:NAD(P)-binding Rossmann-like domain